MEAFMAANIAWKRAAAPRPRVPPPEAGRPARLTRPRPRGSSQLVISRHFLAARPLEPHRDLAVERVPVDVTFHGSGLSLAMSFHNQVVLRHSSLRQHLRDRLGTTARQLVIHLLGPTGIGVTRNPH